MITRLFRVLRRAAQLVAGDRQQTAAKTKPPGSREPGGLAKTIAAYFGASVGVASGAGSAIFFFFIVCLVV
jgi:hypothetical protein